MDSITIKTNHHQRELKSLAELTEAIVDEWFDYLHNAWYGQTDEALQPRFFQYRGAWYDTQEFQRIELDRGESQFPGWDGVQTESAFSGVLLKWGHDWSGQPDYEQVIIGYAHW